jgi:hypothetical protein
MQALIALSPLIIRVLKIVVPVLLGLLLLPILAASAILNKSTVVWPVVAPTQVAADQHAFVAAFGASDSVAFVAVPVARCTTVVIVR